MFKGNISVSVVKIDNDLPPNQRENGSAYVLASLQINCIGTTQVVYIYFHSIVDGCQLKMCCAAKVRIMMCFLVEGICA